MKSISIIVPVYNVEKYLQECIESLIKQTFRDIEILLIDDGSTDKSGQICDLYSDKYDFIKVIHKSNGGVCSARNLGISIAKGEYISFIDSDDYIENNFYEILYNESKKYNLDILFCNYVLVEDNVSRSTIQKKSKQYLLTNESITGLEYQKIRFENNDWDNYIWTALLKKSFLEENKLKFYDKGKLLFEDVLFTNKSLLKASRVKYVDFYGYRYRNRWRGSLSRQKSTETSIDSYYSIMNEFIELYYKSVNKDEKRIIVNILYNVLTSLLESIHYFESEDKDIYYKKIKDTDILKIIKKYINTKKNLIKFIIFNINLKLYYNIVDLIKK